MDIKDGFFPKPTSHGCGEGQCSRLLSQAVAPTKATVASEEARSSGSRMGRHTSLERVGSFTVPRESWADITEVASLFQEVFWLSSHSVS